MTDEQDMGGWRGVVRRAVRDEREHLSVLVRGEPDWSRDPAELLQEIVNEAACALIAARMGAATRYAEQHASDEDPELRMLTIEAARVVSSLPPRLHRLWQAHYVDGHPLPVYAESAGLDATAAQGDYLEILRVFVQVMPPQAAGDLSRSGVRPVVAPPAETCGLSLA